ncbi:MAG: DUF3089 domain-containing protein [Saprospiraceae bacterium]|nr:DUF3089 domain-containing protein [Saprospiraceae bacterium]
MKITAWFISFILSLVACKSYKPVQAFQHKNVEKIDYSKPQYWAAHPDFTDESDRTPEGDTVSYDRTQADVFFIHPTTYTGGYIGKDNWNAPVNDKKLDKKTNKGTIRFQASVFNHAGRVFAPRYRQAHIHAYFTKDKSSAKAAFDLAYEDVKTAFLHYLNNENNGRPVIIAGHSQGTNHAERLLDEFFDNKPLQNSLVAAYLLGMPIRKDRFKNIRPCRDSSETGCFVSWRTFKCGHHLPEKLYVDNISVTNPLSWKTDEAYVPKSSNKGSLLFKFNKIYPHLEDAQVSRDLLWANKPKFTGSIFLRTKNYHPADINFYYFNIRENAQLRVRTHMHQKN